MSFPPPPWDNAHLSGVLRAPFPRLHQSYQVGAVGDRRIRPLLKKLLALEYQYLHSFLKEQSISIKCD